MVNGLTRTEDAVSQGSSQRWRVRVCVFRGMTWRRALSWSHSRSSLDSVGVGCRCGVGDDGSEPRAAPPRTG